MSKYKIPTIVGNKNKLECLEYFIFKLFKEDNNLGKLKVNKLFFLLCTVVTKDGKTLINTLDNVYARPYGHDDLDISAPIDGDKLTYFKIDNIKATTKVHEINETDFSEEVRELVDVLYDTLLGYEKKIYQYSGFDLVELSRKWFTWRHYWEKARSKGEYQAHIHKELLIREEKFYFAPYAHPYL